MKWKKYLRDFYFEFQKWTKLSKALKMLSVCMKTAKEQSQMFVIDFKGFLSTKLQNIFILKTLIMRNLIRVSYSILKSLKTNLNASKIIWSALKWRKDFRNFCFDLQMWTKRWKSLKNVNSLFENQFLREKFYWCFQMKKTD